MNYTVKQVSEKIGVSMDTLRYYDKEGILSPLRSENGYRQYDENDILLLKNIIVMKYAHFTLGEMKDMERLFSLEPTMDCNEISRSILEAKVKQLKQRILNYKNIVSLIENLLSMVDSHDAFIENKDKVDEYI